MLIANSFRLISRVILALNGCNIRLLLASTAVGPVTPVRTREQGRLTIYHLDPRWIENLSPDDVVLEQWGVSLRQGSRQPHSYVPTPPVPYVLEHV